MRKLNMKPLNWYIKRKKARQTGLMSMRQVRYVRPKTSLARIEELKKELMIEGRTATEIYEHLQSALYMGLIPNNESAIKNEICSYEEDYNKSFPSRYWNEYVAHITENYDDYKEVVKEEKRLNAVKRILDKHPEYHYLTGERLQEQFNRKLNGKTMNFSWRAWGALMSAYMNTQEQERKYCYMSFYM